ncbi:MAG TPA: YiaA/YiaB family inner membrane protein [Rummeliibacillus sp.]|nr:YiaA/YiaB family inner membrane protein [Rummeliibacillus sp.]
MKSNEFFFLTWAAFITGFAFVLIAIWNTDWMLVERGFYTIVLGWITFSAFSLVKTIRDKKENIRVSKEYLGLCWLSTIASFGIGMISIWNTEWPLVEKGYYWLGIIFVMYTSFALSKEIRDRQNFTDKHNERLQFRDEFQEIQDDSLESKAD